MYELQKLAIVVSNEVSMTRSTFQIREIKSQILMSSLYTCTKNACESLVACDPKLYDVECREW